MVNRIFLSTALLMTAMLAQPPATAPATPPRRPPGGFGSAFPQRPPADPAAVERGKAIYGIHCTFCHGADARGGSGGPNLIRTESVLNDKDGELIGPVLREGREGMPKFDLTPAQVSEIAGFLHSFRVGGYDESRMTPPSILVGDAEAGAAYFAKACAACHSVTGNLKGIASRVTDPKRLQQTWLMPGTGGRGFGGGGATPSRVPPTTATVTPVSGKPLTGRLIRIDDFFVTVADADGAPRTFSRDGDVPRVELHDPLKGHRDLLGKYRDQDIHNVTAFLVTVK